MIKLEILMTVNKFNSQSSNDKQNIQHRKKNTKNSKKNNEKFIQGRTLIRKSCWKVFEQITNRIFGKKDFKAQKTQVKKKQDKMKF